MQILDTRHIELFLNEEYKAGSWDYNLIGSHKLQKDTSAACGAIYDLKHLKASSSSGKFKPPVTLLILCFFCSSLNLWLWFSWTETSIGILHLKSWTGEPEDSQPKAFITTHAVAVHTRLQKNEGITYMSRSICIINHLYEEQTIISTIHISKCRNPCEVSDDESRNWWWHCCHQNLPTATLSSCSQCVIKVTQQSL